MTLTLIILFILIGLILIWLEFFIAPGITVAGIGGAVLMLGGVYLAYSHLGRPTGHIVLLSSLVALVLMLLLSFRGKTWQKTALETNIDAVVEGIDPSKIKAGDTGRTISRLSPMGKVLVNSEIVEAKSKLGFIGENQDVKIIEVFSTNVLVEKAELVDENR